MRSIFAIFLILVTRPVLLEFILVLLLAGFPCKLCPPGSFNNEIRAQTCECCPDGYTSTYMKTSCRPCPANEWAKHENFPNCSLCQTCFTPEDCEYLSFLTLEVPKLDINSFPIGNFFSILLFPCSLLCTFLRLLSIISYWWCLTFVMQSYLTFSPEGPCLSKGTCFPGVSCLNVGVGHATCGPCPKGYDGDGITCDDINEVSRGE